MNYAELEAQSLAALGVPFICGVPGSGPSYELLDACERAGVRFLLTVHEGAGVIIAGAAARQAGGIGAALSIKGPGVANLAAGLVLASFENYPVLTFSESYAPDAPAGLQHKRMPQDVLLGAVAKEVLYRGCADVREMAALALREPAGPVHVNLVGGPARAPKETPVESHGTIDGLLDRISRAHHPILIGGSSLSRPGTERVSRTAISGVRVPVFSTASAKGIIDERTPASAGVYTGAGGPLSPEAVLLRHADLIVGLGLRHTEVLGARQFPASYVSVDSAPASLQEGFAPELHVVADPAAAWPRIQEALQPFDWGLDLVARAHDGVAQHLDTAKLLPARCYSALAAIGGGRLVTDSGNFTIIAEHVWRAAAPDQFVGSSNGRFMGAGIPQALGVALQDSSKPTICSVGDGGLPPFIGELRLAVERRLPLLLVLMTDGHYGSMRGRVLDRGFTEIGVAVTQPSWYAVLAAMGWDAVRAATISQFEAAVASWRPSVGPRFIEAVMPDREYLEMVKPLRP